MNTLQLPTPSLVAIATGVVGSAWVSGGMASLSLFAIPAALASPETAARAWGVIFNRGIAVLPPLAVASAVGYLYAAYRTRQDGGIWKGFAVAAALTVGIVPYTMIFLNGINYVLLDFLKGTKVLEQGDVLRLVGRWGVLNLGRCLFPLAGAIAGAITYRGNVSIASVKKQL
ncbi:hypothetical protein G7046_g2192 [Stylonectria norvegica]|nr:hypothetical protein G7046_g2192 [Stylonectria norvegica]